MILGFTLETEDATKSENFIWRVCRNYLLTCMSLKDKGLNNITSCVMCSRHNDDRLHLFSKIPGQWRSPIPWNRVGHGPPGKIKKLIIIRCIL